MNDSLIYPCLIHLMKVIDSKERNNPQMKEFYHTKLILKHLTQAKQIFNTKLQIYKNLLQYYQENWILRQSKEVDISENSVFLQQIQQLDQKQKSVCQIIVRIVILGISSHLNVDVDNKQLKIIRKMCEDLHLDLIFENLSISALLINFLQRITIQIKNLPFYESLLKLFKKLDYYQIIAFLQKAIQSFRQEWTKNQKQIQNDISKKKRNRDSIFFQDSKQNNSVDKRDKVLMDENNKTTVKSLNKMKQAQPQKSSFKQINTKIKVQNSSRRRTFFRDNRVQFNKKIDISTSLQSISFQETKIEENQQFRMVQSQFSSNSYIYPANQVQNSIEEVQMDFLAENTPSKKKKWLIK